MRPGSVTLAGIFVVSTISLLLGQALAANAQTVGGTVERTFQVDGTPEISVRSVDGPIILTVHDRPVVTVTAVKQVDGALNDAEARRLAEDVTIDLRQEGSRIDIIVRQPHDGWLSWFTRPADVVVRLEIVAPRASTIDVRSVDGRIESSGTTGRVSLQAVDGDIEVTSGGGVLTVQSVDGNVNLRGVTGEVEARTVDGDLRLAGRPSAVRLRTIDGDMSLRVEDGTVMTADWRLATVDGDIGLSLPAGFAADLDFQTHDGRIRTPSLDSERFSRGHVVHQLNGGGHQLHVESADDGDIELEY